MKKRHLCGCLLAVSLSQPLLADTAQCLSEIDKLHKTLLVQPPADLSVMDSSLDLMQTAEKLCFQGNVDDSLEKVKAAFALLGRDNLGEVQ